MGDVANPANHRNIGSSPVRWHGHEGMQVLEDIDCRFHFLQHRVHGRNGIGCAMTASLRWLCSHSVPYQALRAGPHLYALVASLSDLRDASFDPLFFPAHHVNDRISSTYKDVQLLG